MKASLRSVRIAPKKANLVAKIIRGMTAADAMHMLERINKKAARIFEELLRSAMANASHNDKQDAQTLVIKTLVVNQGQAYRRGIPKARGQIRPIRKFLSHIDITLGLPEDETMTKEEKKNAKKAKSAKNSKDSSPNAKTPVKGTQSRNSGTKKKTGSTAAPEESASPSSSATS